MLENYVSLWFEVNESSQQWGREERRHTKLQCHLLQKNNHSRSFAGACKVFENVCYWFLAAMMSLFQTANTETWPQTTFAPVLGSVDFPISGRQGGVGGSSEEDRGWKGTGKQMASYLSLLCEGCHSNRLMQGSGKEKKRQRQSRKGLGKTIEPRATGQICRLGHNRWSFFNRQGQLLQATCAAVPCFKRSHALFTYDSANG